MSAVDVVKLLSSALASTKVSLKLRSACWFYTAPSSGRILDQPRDLSPPFLLLFRIAHRDARPCLFAFRAYPSVPVPALLSRGI